MISWSREKQLSILGATVLVAVVFLGVPIFFTFYRAPTCFDGKQNQNETGVDCGGQCSLICKAEALPQIVRWQRVFRVVPGTWNAVAYVENPNTDSGALRVPYVFKLYDSRNILVAERHSLTDILPRKTFAVFEGGFSVGDRIPTRVVFEFGTPIWQRGFVAEAKLSVSGDKLEDVSGAPRLTALITNPNLSPVSDIEVVAIIYDIAENALASSRTTVDLLRSGESAEISFTWPEPFSGLAVRQEFLYRVKAR